MLLLVCLAFLTTIVSSIVLWFGVVRVSRLSTVYLAAAALPLAAFYVAVCIWKPPVLLLADALILAVAVFAGSILGRLFRSPASLVAFAAGAGVADFVSFNSGVTRATINASHSGASRLFEYLSLTIPLPPGSATPIVGIGDLLILAAFMTSLHQLGYGRAALIVPASGLVAALAIGFVAGGIGAVPVMAAILIVYLLWTQRARLKGT